MFLRYLPIECVQMHIAVAPDSPVTAAYIRIKKAGGSKDCKDSSSPEAAADDILHAQKTDGLRCIPKVQDGGWVKICCTAASIRLIPVCTGTLADSCQNTALR